MGEDRHPQELLWESIGKNHFREKRGQRTPHLQMCLSTAEVLSDRGDGAQVSNHLYSGINQVTTPVFPGGGGEGGQCAGFW